MSVQKIELVVGATLDQSEPSPRFTSNGIHTKSGADNLQGNGLGKGPGASQVLIRKRKPKAQVSKSLEHFLGDDNTLAFLTNSLFSQKSINQSRVSIAFYL